MDARGWCRGADRRRGAVNVGNRPDASCQRYARRRSRRSGRSRGAAIGMLRLGMDVDGVLADFRSSFRVLATSELGPRGSGADESGLSKEDVDRLWKAVGRRANWWMTLGAYESEQITRLYDLTRQRRWEVFFMTSRPPSGGDTVQTQTQVWLERHGFYLPTVLTAPAGARGELSRSLRLDVVVDD